MKPLALDLCCGLGGWTHGLLAEGWDVIGFDIENHQYNGDKYPGQLVIQDIRTLDGRQFRGKVLLITASPPCTEFSYMAMPWTRGKKIEQALLGKGDFPVGYKGSKTRAELTELFDACVRIGQEAGCPIVIENVRGAQPWVGRARWNFGSFYLWGDVPALMPITYRGGKTPSGNSAGNPLRKDRPVQRLCDSPGDVPNEGFKTQGMNWSDRTIKGQDFTRIAGRQSEGQKVAKDGLGEYGGSFGWNGSPLRRGNSKSSARKAASATIAKIPLPLARWIARVYNPQTERRKET